MASKPKVEVAREHLSKAQDEAVGGDLRDAVQWSFASLEATIDALAEKHGISIEDVLIEIETAVAIAETEAK